MSVESAQPAQYKLGFNDVFVDSVAVEIPTTEPRGLELGAGLHRLDFDFGFNLQTPDGLPQPPTASGKVTLRCQLEGIDERWQETDLGMSLVCQALDQDNRVISQSRFKANGRSSGWETSPEDSVMTRRVVPVFIPENARKLKLTLSSGSPDTTGFWVIDYIGLHAHGESTPSLWKDGVFNYDAKTTSPAGTPEGWQRNGGDPAIARMILRSPRPGIGLVDGDQANHGEWVAVQELPASSQRSRTFSLSWYEAYNVIGGSNHRATYVNVPPGKYTFRAIGQAGATETIGDEISLSVLIRPPFWQRFWFWPAITTMDDLVWAVDPAHDTLDHLASHLARLAEEMFRDSHIRCRLDIPSLLPPRPLGAEFRHHFALAVKEALHNVLRHAGPCEVFFTLSFDGEEIVITVRDTGVGFDLASDERGHGLDNLASRFKEIGGSCKITSSPGAGTSIVFSCRLGDSGR